MKKKITCPDCGNDSFEMRAGPEGEPDYSLICQDCGCEIVLDDAMRAALEEQGKHRGGSRT